MAEAISIRGSDRLADRLADRLTDRLVRLGFVSQRNLYLT
jgi:hypothetical protein